MLKKTIYTLLYASLLLTIKSSFGQTAPNLGSAASFALFTASGAITNEGATVVTGDIGTNAGAYELITPPTVIGQIHVADAMAQQAALAVASAYGDLSTNTCGPTPFTSLGNSQTLTPGVYCLGAASAFTGNLTLDGQGNPNALFIFRIGGALSASTLSMVTLINSASASKVFWQVNGAFSLGANSAFKGTIIANGDISLLEGSSIQGRALSTAGAIHLHTNIVVNPGPDLTPVIDMPQALFSSAPDAVRDFVVNIEELTGTQTSSGNVAITLTAPIGYSLTYANSISSINVTGGTSNPVAVDNINWHTSASNSQQISLTMNTSQFIAAGARSRLGFTIARTTANAGSVSNITVNVTDDPTHTYDGNPINNVYARIISGL